MKRWGLVTLLAGCAGTGGSSLELESGSFEGDRTPVLSTTVMAWNDRMTFNAGYQERAEPAFEVVASQSAFDVERDLLSLDGSAFLDVVHGFQFGDALHLRIHGANSLIAGDELQLDSAEGSDRWQLAFKLGAEPLGGDSELDDPRRGFRLPGQITAKLRIESIERAADNSITRLESALEVKVDRCPPSEHNRGEGEAYRPGSFKARLLLEPMSERLAEHNLKLLLGLSPLPLPDNNGFEFPGFTRNCRNNPRPPID